MKTWRGRCHCGAIAYDYQTANPVEQWDIRACQCTFCTRHGALTTTDPQGRVRFFFEDPGVVRRYRFGAGVTDFIICGRCGVYVGAVCRVGETRFATLNTRTMGSVDGLPAARAVTYGDMDGNERLERRGQMWTPVTGEQPA